MLKHFLKFDIPWWLEREHVRITPTLNTFYNRLWNTKATHKLNVRICWKILAENILTKRKEQPVCFIIISICQSCLQNIFKCYANHQVMLNYVLMNRNDGRQTSPRQYRPQYIYLSSELTSAFLLSEKQLLHWQ